MNRRILLGWVGLVVLEGTVVSRQTHAHDRSTSYSTWRVDGKRVVVRLRVSSLDATRLPQEQLSVQLASSLTAAVDGAPCSRADQSELLPSGEPGFHEQHLSLLCPAGESLSIKSELFSQVAPSHIHLAKVMVAGVGDSEHVLVEGARQVTVSLHHKREDAGWGRFVYLGAEHVLSGADHLVFLGALLLGARKVGSLLWVITGFTLGHSVALSLCALGVVKVNSAAVEALIGLSIALVAAENIWLRAKRKPRWLSVIAALLLASLSLVSFVKHGPATVALVGASVFSGCYLALLQRAQHPERARAAVAAGFGLVHGLAFAGGLLALDISKGHILQALVGFNVGVELGQLVAIVVLSFVLLLLSTRPQQTRDACVSWGSAAMLATGVAWLVERSLF